MAAKNEVRIIAGRWRGRRLNFPPVSGLRPTPGVVRETLFNWLQAEAEGSRCLDLFAGSGALGFEAASRGAARVVEVEAHPKVVRALKRNITMLDAPQMEVVAADVKRFLRRSPGEPFDLVFLDPPFGEGWVGPCCETLEADDWLAPGARIYVEAERDLQSPPVPGSWERLRHKQVGDVGCHLYRRLG